MLKCGVVTWGLAQHCMRDSLERYKPPACTLPSRAGRDLLVVCPRFSLKRPLFKDNPKVGNQASNLARLDAPATYNLLISSSLPRHGACTRSFPDPHASAGVALLEYSIFKVCSRCSRVDIYVYYVCRYPYCKSHSKRVCSRRV